MGGSNRYHQGAREGMMVVMVVGGTPAAGKESAAQGQTSPRGKIATPSAEADL